MSENYRLTIMKELSIEEKAKAYDEAISIMEKYMKSGNAGVIAENTIKKAFPELRESEDERIMNRLIDYFYSFLDGFEDTYKVGGHVKWEGLDVKNVIAWLEKQKHLYETTKDRFYCEGFEEGQLYERQKEHKYDENSGKPSENIIEKEKGYEFDAEKKELKETEQKQFFDIEIPYGAKDSELQEVCYNIPEGFHAEIEGNKVIIKKGEKKSNWSEGDEKKFRDVIRLVEQGAPVQSIRDHYTNWLKSLKDRYAWKPSEEQINALDEVYKTHGANSACRRVLITLLNDLRKLREDKL